MAGESQYRKSPLWSQTEKTEVLGIFFQKNVCQVVFPFHFQVLHFRNRLWGLHCFGARTGQGWQWDC